MRNLKYCDHPLVCYTFVGPWLVYENRTISLETWMVYPVFTKRNGTIKTSSNESIYIILNFIPTSTMPSRSSLWQLYWISHRNKLNLRERGNCWGQFGGFWASSWPQSVIKDTLTLSNLIFRFPRKLLESTNYHSFFAEW